MYNFFWNFQEGGGGGGGEVTVSSLIWKVRRGGGFYTKFPPWWGYGYFLELHNRQKTTSISLALKFNSPLLTGCTKMVLVVQSAPRD